MRLSEQLLSCGGTIPEFRAPWQAEWLHSLLVTPWQAAAPCWAEITAHAWPADGGGDGWLSQLSFADRSNGVKECKRDSRACLEASKNPCLKECLKACNAYQGHKSKQCRRCTSMHPSFCRRIWPVKCEPGMRPFASQPQQFHVHSPCQWLKRNMRSAGDRVDSSPQCVGNNYLRSLSLFFFGFAIVEQSSSRLM